MLNLTDPILQLDKMLGSDKMSIGYKESPIGGMVGDCSLLYANNI